MAKKHGMYGTDTYKTWARILRRCNNPNDVEYSRYGGRGINVCDEWRDFNNFYKDMGKKPSSDYSIDRINVNEDYKPSNCKWSDSREQAINKRLIKTNKSGLMGVHFCKSKKKWVARYNDGIKRKHLGTFKTFEEAMLHRYKAEDESDYSEVYQDRRNKYLLEYCLQM